MGYKWKHFRPKLGGVQLTCLYCVDQPTETVRILFEDANDMASFFGVGKDFSLVQIQPRRKLPITIEQLSRNSWEEAWKDEEEESIRTVLSINRKGRSAIGKKKLLGRAWRQSNVLINGRSSGTTDEENFGVKRIVQAQFKLFIQQLLERHSAPLQNKKVGRSIHDVEDTANSGFTSRAEARPVEEANKLVLHLRMIKDLNVLKNMESAFIPNMTVELINDSHAPPGLSTEMNVNLEVEFLVGKDWSQDSLSLSLECNDQNAVILKDEEIVSQLVPESKDPTHPSLCLADSPDFVISRRSTRSTMRYRSYLWNHSSTEKLESRDKLAKYDARRSVCIKVKGYWQLLGDDINIHKFAAEKQLQWLDNSKPHNLGSDIRVCHNFSPRVLYEGLASAQQLIM